MRPLKTPPARTFSHALLKNFAPVDHPRFMTDQSSRAVRVLTVIEVAALLRCSKAHVHNLINGKVPGVPPLPSLCLGRRRLVLEATLANWIIRTQREVA